MTSENSVRFTDLKLMEPLLKALTAEGYEFPTPIQQKAIPHILARRDLLGCAQTGTGKTAAFALPMLQLLAETPAPINSTKGRSASKNVRALILTPTRELAAQIGESFDRYGLNLKISNTVIFGGVGQSPQAAALRRGVDIMVATPGRLLDLIDQRLADLSGIEIFVLDEADRMLDMGFIHDVRRIIKLLPKKRHTLFFSATMPTDIQRLAQDILSNPIKVEVTPVASTADKIVQSVYFVEKNDKRFLLEDLMKDASITRALVFSRTKHGADRICKFLNNAGVPAEAIHGNKSQNNRVRALNNFKEGQTRVLVATDIAARGIDIDGVTHVINYELPNIPESYVHRIGRTARAGAEGIAFSFCDREERAFLTDIERLIRKRIPVATHSISSSASAQQSDSRGAQSEQSFRAPASRGPGNRRDGGGAQSGGRSQGSRSSQIMQRRSPGRVSSQGDRQASSSAGRPNDTKGRYSQARPTANRVSRPSSDNRSSRTPMQPREAARSASRESASTNAKENSREQSKPTSNQPWWKKLVGSKK